jgi:ketosteroid isomerase-like protein
MTLTSVTSTTQAVVNHHLERFAALDLQGVVADYAPDAVMIVPTAVLRGVQEITPLFQSAGGRAGRSRPPSIRRMQRTGAEGPVASGAKVAVVPRAASGLARPSGSRAAPAEGSPGTLCPRLPGLLTVRVSSGLAGEELHGRDKGDPGRAMA